MKHDRQYQTYQDDLELRLCCIAYLYLLHRDLFEYKIYNVGYENRLTPTSFVTTLSAKNYDLSSGIVFLYFH